jgi:hypothetical protein
VTFAGGDRPGRPLDDARNDIDRWIAYGTQTSNTFSMQAVDRAGNAL